MRKMNKKIIVRAKDGTKIHETFITKPQIKLVNALGIDLNEYAKALVEFEMEKKNENNAHGSEQAKQAV
jgi:hypothetical protein